MTSIEQAIRNKSLGELKALLLENPASINEPLMEGMMPVHLAAREGNLILLKYMIEECLAKLNEVDNRGRNCLHYGAESGELDRITYLVEVVGYSLVEGDYQGMTPFDILRANRSEEVRDYVEGKTGITYDAHYHNPIRQGMYPDPSIVRVGEDYYMVNSSFIYFPSIPISHSKDLIHWTIIGHAITESKWSMLENLEGGRGYWAPDISYYKGKFYITATLRLNDGPNPRKQIVVSSSNPEGPYNAPSILDIDGIDPSLFADEDGKRYMLLNRGARLVELNADATRVVKEPELIYYGDNKRATEGPHLLKKDGWYYLFLAEGGTGRQHQISVARSRLLKGPYEACPYNPIMTQSDMKGRLQCCGHGKPVMTHQGKWFMVYLTSRYLDDAYGMLGRETAIDPIRWTEDGWPLVNNLQGPSCIGTMPITLVGQTWTQPQGWMDSFKEPCLDKGYMFPRPPKEGSIVLDTMGLKIFGEKEDLTSIHAGSIIVRRQTSFDCVARVTLSLPSENVMGDSGMISYYDENTWLKFALVTVEHETVERKSSRIQAYDIKIIENIGTIQRIHVVDRIIFADSETTIELKMVVQGLQRMFYYNKGEEDIYAGELKDVSYLSSEGFKYGKRFTGATIGLYAHKEWDGDYVARFHQFSIESIGR